MSVSQAIKEQLTSSAELVALLATFEAGGTNYPYIFDTSLIPKAYSKNPAVNYYQNSPLEMVQIMRDRVWTINSWSGNESTTRQMSGLIAQLFNQEKRTVDDTVYVFLSSQLPIVPPADEGEFWNQPVEVRIRNLEG